ncbi:YdcF family protein [Allonocardiopsis opalescens]|uniref:Vancomycin permeability regulator SanA n=1 Tax=Allonocardiopsis opalescens TaxID=1144618 RepID=A0A2T0QFL6_9ACTN|nr:vancomycin permeability regulator SanA [Allonocardiopsis opalescens]
MTDNDKTQVFRRAAERGGTRSFTRSAPDDEDRRETRMFERGGGPAGTPAEAEEPEGPARARRRRHPVRRFVLWTIALLLLVALLIPGGTWVAIWYTARLDDRPPSDAIIVLGASQFNGTPSQIFQARLEHAAELYESGVADQIVTVGGSQPGDLFTEAGSGRDWLVETGVPETSITALDVGSDTLQSIQAVSEVFTERGWSTAIIVTDPWHSLRSRVIAGDYGIDAVTSPTRSGPAVWSRETQINYITRETGALIYYRIFGTSTDVAIDAV